MSSAHLVLNLAFLPVGNVNLSNYPQMLCSKSTGSNVELSFYVVKACVQLWTCVINESFDVILCKFNYRVFLV